jgi:2-(1,2-epoxy-1,2-dihydrophenyl)acetyl-CoA isomerase
MPDVLPDVLYDLSAGVATITLNRPDRLNAMGGQMIPLVLQHLEQAASDDAARVVVLTGAGRGFCAGGDLSAGPGGGLGGSTPVESKIRGLRELMRSSQLLHEMPKVTIAAINGACAGAGLSWAAACDLRYSVASAKFTTAFINAGLSGDFGGTWTLPRLVGSARARELYLLSERFTAEEAQAWGFVSKVLPDVDALHEHVAGVARSLINKAPVALARIKANLNDAEDVPFSVALDREADRHARTGQTADAAEAARAFIEKREPRFTGR